MLKSSPLLQPSPHYPSRTTDLPAGIASASVAVEGKQLLSAQRIGQWVREAGVRLLRVKRQTRDCSLPMEDIRLSMTLSLRFSLAPKLKLSRTLRLNRTLSLSPRQRCRKLTPRINPLCAPANQRQSGLVSGLSHQTLRSLSFLTPGQSRRGGRG